MVARLINFLAQIRPVVIWGLIYKMRRNQTKFDLKIISQKCVCAIHKTNMCTENVHIDVKSINRK